jgi:ATP-dependent DNA ligase
MLSETGAVPKPRKHALYTFSLPDKVPSGPDWLHEVNYDGYRMMLIREQDRKPDNSNAHWWQNCK